jgi:hypothetical protein
VSADSTADLDTDELVGRVLELAAAAPDAFADAARAPDVVDLNRDLPNRLADLVADRAALCRHLLGAGGEDD